MNSRQKTPATSSIRQQARSVNVIRNRITNNQDEIRFSPTKLPSSTHIRTQSNLNNVNQVQASYKKISLGSYKNIVEKQDTDSPPKQEGTPSPQGVYHKGAAQTRPQIKNGFKIQLNPSKSQTNIQTEMPVHQLISTTPSPTKSMKLINVQKDGTLPKLGATTKPKYNFESEDVQFSQESEQNKNSPMRLPSQKLILNDNEIKLYSKNVKMNSSSQIFQKSKIELNSSNITSQTLISDTSSKDTKQKTPYKQEISVVACKSLPGKNPDKTSKTNQDSFIQLENFAQKQGNGIFSVCDGHGVEGHKASQYIRDMLPTNINLTLNSCSSSQQFKDCLNSAFKITNSALNEDSGVDCTFSGSTCVLTLMLGRTLYTANVGDSRSVVGKFLPNSASQIQAHPLSFDHKPDNPKEQKRIEQSGGRVQPFLDYDGTPLGPARVWKKDQDIPGLAMSRSFGDRVAAQCGVIAKPEITMYELTDDDRFIVLASDGVWEFLSNQQVCEMIYPFYKNNQADLACQKVVKESALLWKANDDVVDDITCQIIFLKR